MNLINNNNVEFKNTYAQQSNIRMRLNQLSPSLRSFALHLERNEFEANDLFQDTVLRVICNAEKFRKGTNFKAWTLRIMKNIFINNYRKRKRLKAIYKENPNNTFLNSEKRMVNNNGESNTAFLELKSMVSVLPEHLKQPFLMAYKGYKYKEISKILDTPLGTIKSRIFIARQTLQGEIEKSTIRN